MKALIDTNILYRIADIVPQGKYSRKKLINRLNVYDMIIVSELSIYELFTRFRLNRKSIKKVLRFIKSNRPKYKIMPHPIEGFEPLEIVNLIINNPKKYTELMDLYGRVFSKKIFIEFNIIKYIIEAAIVIFAIIIDEENVNQFTTDQMTRFMESVFVEITAFRDSMTNKLRTVLIIFYSESKKKAWLKNEIETILLPCLFTLSVQYILIQNGLNLTQVDTMSDTQKQIVNMAIENNTVIMNILNRLDTGNGQIFDRISATAFERSITMYEREMLKSINRENILYYEELFKRIFFDGKKIEKNDVIDSEFLRYFYKDDIEIISLDGGFRNIVKEFDPVYAKKMNDWEKTVLDN